MKRAKSVDDYIADAGEWRAGLGKLRRILQATDLEETVKWGAPCYTYGGKNVVGMMAFKGYMGLWFHQGALLKDDAKVLVNAQEGKTKALRQWRMQSEKDIRPTLIKKYVREAIKLVKDGKAIAPAKKKALNVPQELKAALSQNKTIQSNFSGLTPGKQREYAEYIASAKRAETKATRIEKILPMIRAGVGLNDKYR